MTMHRSTLDAACRAFGIEPRRVTAQPRSTLCEVLRVDGDGGEAVGLKLYPAEAASELAGEVAYVAALAADGCPVPRPRLARDGRPWWTAPDGRCVVAHEWVPGRSALRLGAGRIERLLAAVATLHRSAARYRGHRDPGWMWQEQRRYAEGLAIPAELSSAVAMVIAADRPWPADAATCVCHNDLNPGNVIWGRDGRPWIIDFTNAASVPLAWDLAVLCAELALGATDVDPRAVVERVITSYPGGLAAAVVNELVRLLPCALVQRSIFKAHPAPVERRSLVWTRLARQLDALVRPSLGHPEDHAVA